MPRARAAARSVRRCHLIAVDCDRSLRTCIGVRRWLPFTIDCHRLQLMAAEYHRLLCGRPWEHPCARHGPSLSIAVTIAVNRHRPQAAPKATATKAAEEVEEAAEGPSIVASILYGDDATSAFGDFAFGGGGAMSVNGDGATSTVDGSDSLVADGAERRVSAMRSVLRLLERMKQQGPQPDRISYGTAVMACAKAHDWQAAERVVLEMGQVAATWIGL